MILGFLSKYLLPIALSAALAASVWAGFMTWRMSSLTTANKVLEARVATCDARIGNIMEDRESDAEVDDMRDLRDLPPGWLMPAP